ncbi:unnamed protein product, partial [marine sediment metagenome]
KSFSCLTFDSLELKYTNNVSVPAIIVDQNGQKKKGELRIANPADKCIAFRAENLEIFPFLYNIKGTKMVNIT